MKKLLLIILLFAGMANAKAQSGLTHIDTTYVWSILETGWGWTTSYYFFQGDTIIGDHQYKKLFRSYLDSTLSNPVYYSAIREENGKVYQNGGFFMMNDSLLYDHNLQAGDSVDMCFFGSNIKLPVDSVNSIIIDGQARKRIVFDPVGGGYTEVWIESIGSSTGLPFALINWCMTDIGYYLLCVYKDGNIIYDSPQFTTCFESSINIPELKSGILFYPNPLTDVSELEILNSAAVFQRLIIVDVSGRIIRELPVIANNARIFKSGLKDGIYFYFLKNETQTLRGKFIVR